MRNGLGGMLAIAALIGMPAQAACWEAQEVAAGTIRDFQSMLMVATLRCQVMRRDVTADYNAFLRANRPTIQAMNDRLKRHFLRAAGPVAGQRAYDAFATSLANAYGAAAGGGEACAGVAALAREAAMMAGSEEGLVLLARRQGLATPLPEGACGGPAEAVVIAGADAGGGEVLTVARR